MQTATLAKKLRIVVLLLYHEVLSPQNNQSIFPSTFREGANRDVVTYANIDEVA